MLPVWMLSGYLADKEEKKKGGEIKQKKVKQTNKTISHNTPPPVSCVEWHWICAELDVAYSSLQSPGTS